ncbi:DUF1798 family protein [Staphylococcus sp. 18_1_E_LY]|uniref:DUF1798 family protein n=1 Tax=Staphylococcus lloydii TaxID=2781774 RepID=A0A7T1F8G7_9STAP|nr:DUF1798 family protein [Staphylococcus lloydii]MBF7018686.1 DUF1798 family protein [Staphylococcus lloydii]MBF7026414.1 DUF1798 family protein [Staphylococcus lloydii]MDU9417697.1 DUF1798 family protein [Staphylococcus lloydii]QPM74087.1 DUF1798 family protein [Staphylococcus lloydii]
MPQFIDDLINDVQLMQTRYEIAKEEGDYDFYEVVKPFTTHIDNLITQIKAHKTEILSLSYMNNQKFEILISNIETLSVECHFKRTSRKLFMEKLKAVQYDLGYIQRSELPL